MKELLDTKIFIGTVSDLTQTNDQDWALVHATQTIHYKIFGWNKTTNKSNNKHPNYIFYEENNILSLNWVDGAARFYEWGGAEAFNKTLDFVEKWSKQRKILIHCDQGQSRSPTLGLLYLAKRLKSIPNDSFENAKNEFIKIYPNYSPGGISGYVAQHWNEIK